MSMQFKKQQLSAEKFMQRMMYDGLARSSEPIQAHPITDDAREERYTLSSGPERRSLHRLLVALLRQLYRMSFVALLAVLLVSACSEGFEPFNEVDKFRILALKAEPPLLTEGGITVITPLIHVEDEDKPVTYKWSWCPIAANTKEGGGCVVDEEMIRAFAKARVEAQAGENAAELLDTFPFSFDLGAGPTAQFIYALPKKVLSDLCTELVSVEIPSFTGIPQCATSFDVVIRLDVTQGKKTLSAVKRVPLYIDETRATNTNPEIVGLTARDADGDVLSSKVRRGETLSLKADIPKTTVDMLLPIPTTEIPEPVEQEETLFMTWYVTGGSTEFVRTTYIEDEVSMKVLRTNSWRIPSKADFDGDTLFLYLVLQDEQGGADWLVRRFEIEEGAS